MNKVIILITRFVKLLRSVWRLMSLLLWFFVMFVFFVFSKILNLRIGKKIPRIFHTGVLKILNIKISLFGKLDAKKTKISISIYQSVLDILNGKKSKKELRRKILK